MTDAAKVIANGKVVAIHYVLTSDKGEELDRSREDDPMHYLHGHHNIVPGLEKQLAGKTVGDHVSAVVPPEEGYGLRRGKPQAMRKSEFPKDAVIEKGARFMVRTKEGQAIPIWITKVQGPTVMIDHNHPLAGQTLHFEVDVVDVRDATDEEMKHGHAHGPGGHHHHGEGEGDSGHGDHDHDHDHAHDHEHGGHGHG